MTTLEPKIYVACLAAYNNGHLHGAWIDANQDEDSLFAAVQEMLKTSPIPNAEEWAIHDYEDFGEMHINEYTDLATISTIAAFVVEHGELGAEVLAYFGDDLDDAQTLLEQCYLGEYDNEADFVEQFLKDTGTEIPKSLVYYIDYEKMAYDWFINDFISFEVNRKFHVFSRY